MIMMNEYRAKAALRSNNFDKMAEAKVALEKIYKEIDEIIKRFNKESRKKRIEVA
ncbi:hypothetical protein C7P86_13425, partial [Staphylococcus aureus]|uniref:complement inhibitor SCIN family protein n=1 Tax=Staphylococcus aureus TaxID=1280 RepID=UPI000DAFC529